MTDITAPRRQRGVVKASLTKLGTKTAELETLEISQTVVNHSQQLIKRLVTLDADFKTHHMSLIDATEDEEQLGVEQEALDCHDDEVTNLSLKLQALSSSMDVRAAHDRVLFEHKLARL